MKRRNLIVLTIVLALALVASLPASASSRHPFRGSWQGLDSDFSTISLKIVEEARSQGIVFEIRARDDRTGGWCSTNGPAEMKGVGVLTEENTIAASLIWWCLPPGEGTYPFPGSNPPLDPDKFVYDPSTDTVTDKWGTVYQRSQ
jgi:hypothetical protein